MPLAPAFDLDGFEDDGLPKLIPGENDEIFTSARNKKKEDLSRRLLHAMALFEELSASSQPFPLEDKTERRKELKLKEDNKDFLNYSGEALKLASAFIGIVEHERDIWRDTALRVAKGLDSSPNKNKNLKNKNFKNKNFKKQELQLSPRPKTM